MKRLLVVEDDADLRMLYTEEFRDEGFAVWTADSAEAALDLARCRPIDIVVLDICLGGASGLDLMRRLLIQNPGLPIVVNSAYPAYKSDFGAWAADAYVVKTSDVSELKETVRDLLAQRAA